VTDSEKIDRYIQNAQPFAQPILEKLRKAVHKGCPGVVETVKWGMPYFVYQDKILCGMAGFKKHVGFGFWQSKLMDDPADLFATGTGRKASMSNIHFHAIGDVPTQKVLLGYIRQARSLIDDGV